MESRGEMLDEERRDAGCEKMFGSKRVAGLNNGKTAYYTCGEHVGCECRYRVTFSTKNNSCLVAKQKYMDHERGELPRVELQSSYRLMALVMRIPTE